MMQKNEKKLDAEYAIALADHEIKKIERMRRSIIPKQKK